MAEDDEQKPHVEEIIGEFNELMNRSKLLFSGLKDLPQYGQTHWQPYFLRTFEVYAKLWKFQQVHRKVLDSEYGLKRWQIGEIASRIGQIYYHYYLRTSESNYLNESFMFYAAIRSRSYFCKSSMENKPELAVKVLRFYARFIVVCLLLRRFKLVSEIIENFGQEVEEYIEAYNPTDQAEWKLVLEEIHAFVEAENVITVDGGAPPISFRLVNVPVLDFSISRSYTLQEVLIAGGCQEQIKFSELTIDMYRMLQAVEKEPSSKSSSGLSSSETDASPTCRDNPHKFLLYKPTVSSLLALLSSGFKDISTSGVLLFYLSGDEAKADSENPPYGDGGIRTSFKRVDIIKETVRTTSCHLDAHCFYAADLIPFIRKPMLLIIDSYGSKYFQNFNPQTFGQPFIALLSPSAYPPLFDEPYRHGGLFTLFLISPALAFCRLCNVKKDLSIREWNRISAHVSTALKLILRSFYECKQIDSVFLSFMGDEFLRMFIVRFAFCCLCLRLHRSFIEDIHYPKSQPRLTADILNNVSVCKVIIDMSAILDAQKFFMECYYVMTNAL